jgi:hypothetical protein
MKDICRILFAENGKICFQNENGIIDNPYSILYNLAYKVYGISLEKKTEKIEKDGKYQYFDSIDFKVYEY